MALGVVGRQKAGGGHLLEVLATVVQPSDRHRPDPGPRQIWDFGYWHVLLRLHDLPTEAYTPLESGDKCQVSGMPVHSWRG